MNTEHELPISYVKQFTPLVVGDIYYNNYLKLELAMDQQEVDAFNSGVDHFNTYFIVSFVDRPNTGTQPVGDDVVVDLPKTIGGPCVASKPRWVRTAIIPVWKPNHAAMLAKFKSEQGANMNTFTKDNTMEATGYAIITNDDAVPCFYKIDNEDEYHVLHNDRDNWSSASGSPYFKYIELSRPFGERKEDHTIDGVVTYALRYKLDLLTEEATHCYKECPTFYRLTLGKYAAVLKNNNQWVTSDCTTNEELNGDEFFALDADQDNHKEDAHHVAIMIEKLGNQPRNHIDLAIGAGAVDDIVISPDEPEEQLKADDDKLKLIEQLKNCFYDNRHDSLISALDKALVGFNISRKKQ